MKIWNTKYALTRGIIEQEGEDVGDSVVMIISRNGSPQYLVNEGEDWHRTREGAVERAELMLNNEITRARRRLDSLEVLRSIGWD